MHFLNFYEHTKNQFIPVVPFWDRVNFSVLRPEWPHQLLTMSTPIFCNQLLISINLYQHAKNQSFLSLRSGDIVNLKILQSDWPKAFWPISQEPDFSKYGIRARIEQIIWTFFIDQIQKKIMAKFFSKSKKKNFGAFLGQKKN